MSSITYDRNNLKAAYLPVGNMLQIDRVYNITEKGLTAEMDLAKHWVFPLHFPSDPIFPGSLMIEAAGQAVAIWAWHYHLKGDPRMAKVKAEFFAPSLPHDNILRFETKVVKRNHICFGKVNIYTNQKLVSLIEPVITIVPQK